MTQSKNVVYEGIELDVQFDYEPEEKQVWTYSNGDPGHPGSPEMFIIYDVFVSETNITALLSDDQLEQITELLKQQ